MRSFLTRLVNSVTRVVLVAPCLLLLILVCSACVTSFPLDTLEVDMTMEQATGAFGEPSSTSTGELHQAVELLQKENARIHARLESTVGLSETRGSVERKLEESTTQTLRSLEAFVAELDEARGEPGVRSKWIYPHEEVAWLWVVHSIPFLGLTLLLDAHIEKHEVDLLFEGDKLVSWETRRLSSDQTTGGSTYVYQDPFPWMTFPSKDTQHHSSGHKHHDGHKSKGFKGNPHGHKSKGLKGGPKHHKGKK